MILDIFSRLPDKSLYRFRCVCKLWSDLICPRINNKNQKFFLLFKEHYSILDCYEAIFSVEFQFNETLMLLYKLLDKMVLDDYKCFHVIVVLASLTVSTWNLL